MPCSPSTPQRTANELCALVALASPPPSFLHDWQPPKTKEGKYDGKDFGRERTDGRPLRSAPYNRSSWKPPNKFLPKTINKSSFKSNNSRVHKYLSKGWLTCGLEWRFIWGIQRRPILWGSPLRLPVRPTPISSTRKAQRSGRREQFGLPLYIHFCMYRVSRR